MERIPFDESELEFSGNPMAPYHYPVPPGQNYIETIHHKAPAWMGFAFDAITFTPRCNPDNVARAFVWDGGPEIEYGEAEDMFGIPWVYVPVAGGSMEKVDHDTIDDVNDWREKFPIPDVDAWDWDGQVEISGDYLANPFRAKTLMIQNGFFERLISFMGFEDAAVAMIDPDQEDAIHDLFSELADMYIRIIQNTMDRWDIDGIELHDDWGSQMAPFFSIDVARKLIVPYIKRVSDFMHAHGKYYMMHCCGNVFDMVPAMLEAGVDSWAPQYPLSDFSKLYATYGKEMVLAVVPPVVDPSASEEEVREIAQAWVDEFIHRDAPVYKSLYSPMENHPLMDKILYELTRKKYSE